MKKIRVGENGVIDGGKKFSYNVIEGQKWFIIIFAQVKENSFEKF
jgi:hypothetical protein